MVSKDELLNNIEALKKRIEDDYFGDIHTLCINWASKNGEYELIIGSFKEAHWLCLNTASKIESDFRKNTHNITLKKGGKDFKMY